MDMSMLTYVWSDRTPDDDGPYVQPLLHYDSDVARYAVPVKRRTVGGTLLSEAYSYTNDGANAGNHSLLVEPQSNSPIELLGFFLYNGDTSARAATINLYGATTGTGGPGVGQLYTANLGAAAFGGWPETGQPGGALPITTLQEVMSIIASVGTSQDTIANVILKYFGDDAPTITPSGPTNCTIAGIL